MKSVVFIRLDRMGDLILTLPCDQLVAKDYQCHWMIPQGLEFVIESGSPPRAFTSLNKNLAWVSFWKLCRWLRDTRPAVSISFHVPWWVNLALWLSRVPVRGGVLSQWHSYLFLNKGLRQKRSQVEAHEIEYNYQLVEHVFDQPRDRKLWQAYDMHASPGTPLPFETEQSYIVVHPGMGGSALNWPTSSYVKFIETMSEHTTVVVTGTKSDEVYLTPLKQELKNNPKVVWLDKQLDGYQLLKLLKNANANIAPSTGVLHLSASLGAASIGIYSPIKVHQAARWGPKGQEVSTFTPKAPCPAHFECLRQECPHYFCMDQLSVEPVLEKTLSYL
jgi:ADP-heptose:LPS heptosyltransferase